MASPCVNNKFLYRTPEKSKSPARKPVDESVLEFEFRLQHPVTMLTADELFSDGKLKIQSAPAVVISPESIIITNDRRCSSKWKHLAKSVVSFFHKNSKASNSSICIPLLKESENESIFLSQSSSSSSCDHDDIENIPRPRLSLDMKKTRVAKLRPRHTICSVTADSPRMNSSGKIVFHSLERSSSSPSSFSGKGGARFKHRGMERSYSYSANVRVSPVLNVPVCSLRFPLFSSPQKRESCAGRTKQIKNRTDRA